MNKKLLILLLPVIALASACGGSKGDDGTPTPIIERISTAFTDNKVKAGQPVTLFGQNFSATASENKILYGVGLDATALRVSQSSATHVVFNAPDVDQKQLNVRVAVKGKESNSFTLVYADPDDDEEPWSDTPTLDFTTMGGTKVTVVPGVEFTEFHGTWESEPRNITIVRTQLNEHNKLGIFFNYSTSAPAGYPAVADGTDYRDLDYKCIYLDAVAGTNGPMACCQFVRVDGKVENNPTESSEWIANCALTIDGDKVDIVKVTDNFKAARLTNAANGSLNPPDNTLSVGCAGPLLVWEGKVQPYADGWSALDKDKWLTKTHPRTAIGISSDGKTVVQVAVDGRWNVAVGMETKLLGKLMKGLGCYKAMNFDGGGGTAMWVYGYGNSRNIVNHVCENSSWNGTTLRPTGAAVYIKSDLKPKK